MSEKNQVISLLEQIVAKAEMFHIPVGRKTFALSDPQLHPKKAGAFVKTQIDLLVGKVLEEEAAGKKEAVA